MFEFNYFEFGLIEVSYKMRSAVGEALDPPKVFLSLKKYLNGFERIHSELLRRAKYQNKHIQP